MKDFVLSNGVTIPGIGFGTYKSTDVYGQNVIEEALACGYRHFDTATLYKNEAEIGNAIAASSISRKELFLASKVPQNDLGYDRAMYHFSRTLELLKTDYLDLYLIHWPMEDRNSKTWRQDDLNTWRALEKLYEEKSVRAIGVCNFLPHHLMNLFASCNVIPMVDQLEFHPGYTQYATVNFCQKHDILVEAWSPFGRGRILQEPLLLELAEKYQCSTAQICIHFTLQNGILPLPKSSTRKRMIENLNITGFELSEEDMSRLMTLPQLGWSGKHPDRERQNREIAERS